MNYMNRTIIVQGDSRELTQRVTQVLDDYDELAGMFVETQEAVNTAITASGNAVTASETAMEAAQEAQEAIALQSPDLPTLLASESSHADGTIFLTRKEGYSYEAVATDPDMTTAGGVGLRAVPFVGRVTPGQYGAVGDGLADDTAALLAALQSGYGVDFGDKVYRFTAPLEIAEPVVDLISVGAKLFYDPPSATRRCVSFTMPLNGTFISEGRLVIDANNKAFDAFSSVSVAIYTDAVAAWPTLVASDLVIRNARRSSLAFAGGNGIEVLGGFRSVILNRPDVRNCTMAVGAEVFGAQGIFGITVGRVTGANPISPDYVEINSPHVENVRSEDPAYLNDQDGIRLFSERRRDGVAPDRRISFIRGGKIKNARNRSIKLQTQNAIVDGVSLEKDSTLNLPAGMTINPDIDWQINGGITRNINVHYDEATPPEIVRAVSARPDETFMGGMVDGITGYIKTAVGATPPIVANASTEAGVTTGHNLCVRNVNLVGPVSCFLSISLAENTVNRALVDGVKATVTGQIVQVLSSNSADLFCDVRSAWNVGASVPLTSNYDERRIFSAVGCAGVSEPDKVFYNLDGQLLRIGALGPIAPGPTGSLRPLSKYLAPGASWSLPNHGMNAGSALMLVSVGASHQSQGVFAVGNGCSTVWAGSLFANGGTSEPASGDFRIWFPSGGSAQLKNASATGRYFNVLMFG